MTKEDLAPCPPMPAARLLARGAVSLTLVGWLLHLGQMTSRGLAAEHSYSGI
ncbi:hypothetical protein [Actinomadura rudentiformis]|uniref:hypothetical protein n=1 Tax=Actinomadura rudentiformis TaxID=359158 RepID=UPI00178C4C98|nr:hypothetical protein [Actinomadura rudentiformis]